MKWTFVVYGAAWLAIITPVLDSFRPGGVTVTTAIGATARRLQHLIGRW